MQKLNDFNQCALHVDARSVRRNQLRQLHGATQRISLYVISLYIYIYINDALPENASTRFTVLNHRTVRSDAATSIIVRRAKTVITESERVAAVISQTPLLASNTRYRGNIQFNYLDSKKIVVNNS